MKNPIEVNKHVNIIIPVFNDWESICLLLPKLSSALKSEQITADVLIVDDGSQIASPETFPSSGRAIHSLRILRLRRNLGHQRAICVGLCMLQGEQTAHHTLIMDGDGEDCPKDAPKLIQELCNNASADIIFAERAKRSEGVVFRFFYRLYRIMYRLLAGQNIRVGNFSVMNQDCLDSLCASSDLWNHFAASAYSTRQRIGLVKTNRGSRLAGESRMNFAALVTHGLSALSVFSDRIATRLLIGALASVVLSLLFMITIAIIRLTADLATPGWATTVVGSFGVLIVQIATFMFTFCFLVLFTRGFSPFIPSRDFHHFVKSVHQVSLPDSTEDEEFEAIVPPKSLSHEPNAAADSISRV